MCSLSSSLSLTKNLARASLSNNNDSPPGPSPPPPPQSLHPNNNKPPLRSRNQTPATLSRKKQLNNRQQKPRQPSVIEIERAIGAGSFRDADPRELEEHKNAKFDMSMMNFPRKFEGPVEKQLRETGEWVTNKTERGFRLSGKKILKFLLLWLLPVWCFSILVASGAIKLNLPFLDDLIM